MFMINKMKKIELKYKDFVPVLSGLIGKIALVTSFALVWAQELAIRNPNFVLENVRSELLIGSTITLIVAIFYPNAAPAGTLAPLVVLVPAMSAFGVHPLILGITVGIIGVIAVKTGVFNRLVNLAGFICKTSITLTFGISGIWMSAVKMYSYFSKEKQIFWVLLFVLILTYSFLFYFNKKWLVIPVASLIAIVVPYLFQAGYQLEQVNLKLNLNPFYWWNDMWGIGFGLDMNTILRTIPFAFFIILLWTIDTVSIQTIREASYDDGEVKEHIDIEQSFVIVSIRNIIGALCGGAQTGSLWRSFLIPLYMVKRPMRNCAILLGIGGMIASILLVPIQIMSYTPLVWSVLLFGIFMPFTITAISSMMKEKKVRNIIIILIFSALGVAISPILTWISSVIYERIFNHRIKK